jgi:hypothetical protein
MGLLHGFVAVDQVDKPDARACKGRRWMIRDSVFPIENPSRE